MTYRKLTRAQAAAAYNDGQEIFLHTNNLAWANAWQNPMPVTKQTEGYNAIDFDTLVNEYAFYNCDKERGMRVIFLIDARVQLRFYVQYTYIDRNSKREMTSGMSSIDKAERDRQARFYRNRLRGKNTYFTKVWTYSY